MPAECQTLQIWLPLTALTFRWQCTDFNRLFTSYNIRKQDTEYITDTIVMVQFAKDAVDDDILLNNGRANSFHVRHMMPLSVNPCISSVIVLPLILSIWRF